MRASPRRRARRCCGCPRSAWRCSCTPRTLEVQSLDAAQLGTAADHFAWMQPPAAVAQALLGAAE
ncbi:hypothetical protein FZ025_18370 [Xanthomonas hyacinthi]|uniref:hypothetical protein n=1 Tax=Xanthomonas hyacinthi TaxID=56455 RepID=UPI0011B03EC6|nr:hypothetical protein [Xanthomonas hyacinthi]QGY78505.1 hypothetical protein FZ025_18370 [Xanthomonas hyacinthi]